MATLSDLTDPTAVAAAVAEFAALGRPRFLERYGFAESRTFFVQVDGQLIDSKPLVAAIWKHQFPQRPALRPEDFSGGTDNAGRALRRLGLEVVSQKQSELLSPVLFVWSAKSPRGRENLEYGLDTQTWGFREFQPELREPLEWLIFGSEHSGRGPRQQAAEWQQGTVDLVLCEVGAPYYRATAPHWPDETADLLYPHRLGITPVARLRAASTATSGPLGARGSEALRMAGTRNQAVREWVDIESLLLAAGVARSESGVPDLSRTDGWSTASSEAVAGTTRQSAGAGRSADAAFNSAVEKRAVAMAIELYRVVGWTEVEELGRPYDLVCRRPDGAEKHVEVKGTTGAGADVMFTPNEIHHFRTCPHGADLVVVRDIHVDRTTTPYHATGGELLQIGNYAAPAEDLQATGWTGRVSGWPG